MIKKKELTLHPLSKKEKKGSMTLLREYWTALNSERGKYKQKLHTMESLILAQDKR